MTQLWTSAQGAEFGIVGSSATPFQSTYLVAGEARWAGPATPKGFVLRMLDGRSIVPPADSRDGVLPAIGAVGDTLYLLWGQAEPREPWPNGMPQEPIVKQLWFSSRTSGGGWSAPRVIATAEGQIEWGPTYASGMTRAPDGSLEMVFVSSTATAKKVLHVARFSRGDVTLYQSPISSATGQLSVARRGDTLFALVVAADTARSFDTNSLFFLTWLSSEHRWSPRTLVQRGGDEGAYYPRVVAAGDGIHAVWQQMKVGVVRHRASRDGGVTWSEPADLSAPGAYPIGAMALGDGGIAVVWQSYATLPPRATIACWTSAGWSPPATIRARDAEWLTDAFMVAPGMVLGTRQNDAAVTRIGNVVAKPVAP